MLAETLTRQRYYLGVLDAIPIGEGRTFYVGGLSVSVFRSRTGEVFATQAVCPHKGGPLADGIVGSGQVICPLHAYRFDLASGQPVGNTCPALKTYPLDITDRGDLVLTLA